MSDFLLEQVVHYGTLVLFLATYLSCLALPVPASLLMLAGGAFVASGDLAATETALACLAGAVAGDLTGYGAARAFAPRFQGWLATRPRRAALMARARAFFARWGGSAVYFSRWLLSPLGPYVNLAAGATGFSLRRFLIWEIPGEATWVALYLGLGFLFSEHLTAVADVLGNLSGFLAGLAVTALLGYLLLMRPAPPRAASGAASPPVPAPVTKPSAGHETQP